MLSAYSEIQTVVFTTTSVTLPAQLQFVQNVVKERNSKNRPLEARASIPASRIAMSNPRQLSEVIFSYLNKASFIP